MLKILAIYSLAIFFAGVIFFLHCLYLRKYCYPFLNFKDRMDNISPEAKKYLLSLKRGKIK